MSAAAAGHSGENPETRKSAICDVIVSCALRRRAKTSTTRANFESLARFRLAHLRYGPCH